MQGHKHGLISLAFWSVVVIEAMFLGIPVIASDIGGLPEMFEHGRSGWLVPAGDAKALAAAMGQLWADPALCRRLGQAAREHALRYYSPSAFYQKLMEAFRQTIDSHGAAASSDTTRSAVHMDVLRRTLRSTQCEAKGVVT